MGAVPRPWPGPQLRTGLHGRVPGAQAGRASHRCGPSPIRGAGAPAPALENGRSSEDPGPASAAPACWARVDDNLLCSAQGLGLGRAVAVALPGAGGQESSPQTEAGGRAGGRRRPRCLASPLGLRLRGLPGAGLSLASA